MDRRVGEEVNQSIKYLNKLLWSAASVLVEIHHGEEGVRGMLKYTTTNQFALKVDFCLIFSFCLIKVDDACRDIYSGHSGIFV